MTQVWCGVVWCGVAWRDVVWHGVAWCGVVADLQFFYWWLQAKHKVWGMLELGGASSSQIMHLHVQKDRGHWNIE